MDDGQFVLLHSAFLSCMSLETLEQDSAKILSELFAFQKGSVGQVPRQYRSSACIQRMLISCIFLVMTLFAVIIITRASRRYQRNTLVA